MRIDFEKENTSITFIPDGDLMYVYTKEGQLIFHKKDLNNTNFYCGNRRVLSIGLTSYEKSVYFGPLILIFLEHDDYFKIVEFLYKWKRWMFSD